MEFEIPADWLSGVYLGKLTAEKTGIQSYAIFIVRDDRPCDLLFQCGDFTWPAYNRWPADYSIYRVRDSSKLQRCAFLLHIREDRPNDLAGVANR